MQVCHRIDELLSCVEKLKQENKTIGLLPTMGALHQGHLSLAKRAKEENDVLICSVFVNPIQFNNKEDLEKYPRNLEADLEALKTVDCDIVFAPSEEEVYAEKPTEKYSFGELEAVMEGPQRPGHFNGVATIVHKLFNWSKADKAYFGEKDYQQIAIIKDLVRQYEIPIQIVECPIFRDADGLATSSRNVRLSPEARKIAPKIHEILVKSANLAKTMSYSQVKSFVECEFKIRKDFELEYFEIVDAKTLQPIRRPSDNGAVGCVAVWLDGVRLIDIQKY
ncbi:MAG: pantoate--beta-alanine ligase [Bacteroidales bacterium]|nr:pantoate--beta-alanine ligase [Bacteroidales bacterium]